MGFWERLFGSKNKASLEHGATRKNPTGYEVAGYGGLDLSTGDRKKFIEAMSGWTYAAVSAIADSVAFVELKLYKMESNGEVKEIVDHPSLDILYKVNGFTTKFDHFWLTETYLKLVGEAPWFIEKENGVPSAIYFLRPDKIRPKPDKDKVIVGYEYDIGNNQKVTLDVDEVVFLKCPNPANPFRGKGVMEYAARTVDIDDESEEWNYRFFQNEARPDSILTVKNMENMKTEQKERLKASLRKQHEGTNNAHKTMVLFGDMELKEFGFSHTDMGFSEQQRFVRDKILAMFRVPKAIVAQTEGVNFSSAKTAQYIFTKYTIEPDLERIVQQLNEFYLPMFGDTEGMYLDFVSPVPEDKEEKLRLYESGINSGYLTVNEVRAYEGLDPLDGMDVPYLPLNLMPVGEQRTVGVEGEKSIAPYKRFRQVKAKDGRVLAFNDKVRNLETLLKEKIKKEMLAKTENEKVKTVEKKIEDRIVERKQLDNKKKEHFFNAKAVYFDKFGKKVLKEQVGIFKSQEKKVLDALYAQKELDIRKESLTPEKLTTKDIDIDKLLLNVNIESAVEITKIAPILAQLFEESGNATFLLLGVNMTMDMNSEEIRKLMKADSRRFAKEVTETTNQLIKDKVKDGLAENEGINDISKRIKNVFASATNKRALLISNTETARFNANANEQAFKDSGVVEAKEWYAEPDACQFCRPLHGKTMALGKNFFDQGDVVIGNDGGHMNLDYIDTTNPPLHPDCRCDIVPVVKEAKAVKKVNVIKKTKIVVVKDDRLKKEYEEKVEKINSKLDEVEALKQETKQVGVEV